MIRLLIIDGQGGRIGRQLAELLVKYSDTIEINAIGTNSAATANMLKSGISNAATGENPVVVMSKKADIIAGPVGIVIADSMMGEVTPKMALSIGQSDATKILIPMNKCENIIAGVKEISLSALIEDAAEKIKSIAGVIENV